MKERNRRGITAAVLGLICNVFLCAAKITVGAIFNSVSVLADGLNNLSDAGSGAVNILGFKWAEKPADKKHPFGHARYEYVSALIVSVVVLIFGIELIMTSVEKIIGGEKTDYSVALFIVLGLSIIVKFGMFLFYKRTAKAISSKALNASAMDSISDVMATSAVLIAAIVAKFTAVDIDGYAGLAVALFILINGIKLIRETVSPLLGEKPSEERVKEISERILSYEGILDVHDVIIHDYGPGRFFASVHVGIDGSETLGSAHEKIDIIERDFALSGINLILHPDPVATTDEEADKIKNTVSGVLWETDEKLTMHDFRILENGCPIFDVSIPYEEKCSDDEITEMLTKKICDLLGKTPIIKIDRV